MQLVERAVQRRAAERVGGVRGGGGAVRCPAAAGPSPSHASRARACGHACVAGGGCACVPGACRSKGGGRNRHKPPPAVALGDALLSATRRPHLSDPLPPRS